MHHLFPSISASFTSLLLLLCHLSFLGFLTLYLVLCNTHNASEFVFLVICNFEVVVVYGPLYNTTPDFKCLTSVLIMAFLATPRI